VAAQTEQIVLLGLPGSGKSTVGPIVAQKLGWRFVDLDQHIEAAVGLSVAQIFATRGEAEFRRIEQELTDRLACEARLVLAPGGGWLLRNQLPEALEVWLQIAPHEAIRRLGSGVVGRPLLQPDPLKRIQQLIAERKQHYNRAELHIDTNGMSAAEVAGAVVVAVTKHNGEQEER
jgi:shikimate kinase